MANPNAVVPAAAQAPATPAQPVPKRGGSQLGFGMYVGGSPLSLTYAPTLQRGFKAAGQLRTIRTIPHLESKLQSNLNDATQRTFNGKLDTDLDATSTDMSKEQFVLAVRTMVTKYGFQNFFYLPNADQSAMAYLLDDPHAFSIDQVLDEFTRRSADPPLPVVDATSGLETPASIATRLPFYDDYEHFDIGLSRLAVESLVHPVLRSTVVTRYDHYENFEHLPGQVYFMLVLDACHASVSLDISSASKSLEEMVLSSFPGQNINDFATEALRHIKMMQHGWSIPFNTGSKLIFKTTKTDSEYFNRQMFTLLDKVKEMERTCGEAGNPQDLTRHADYPTLGPIGICATMQNAYGELIKSNEWVATKASMPEGNLAGDYDTAKRRNPDNKTCHICGSVFHFANNCPDRSSGGSGNKSNSGNNGNGGNGGDGGTGSDRSNKEKDRDFPPNNWRFTAPTDGSTTLTRNNVTYYWCATCRCRRTNRTGLWNRTHSTANHKAGLGKPQDENNVSPPPDTGGANNNGGTQSNGGDGNNSSAPSGNLTPVITETEEDIPDHVDSDPSGLSFHGAYLADAFTDEGAWMVGVNDDDSIAELISGAVGITLVDNSTPVATLDSVVVHTMPAPPSVPTATPNSTPAPNIVPSPAPMPVEPLNVPFDGRAPMNPEALEFLASPEGFATAASLHMLAQIANEEWISDEDSDSDRENWDGTPYVEEQSARPALTPGHDIQTTLDRVRDFVRPPSPPSVVPDAPTTLPSPTPSEQEELDEFLEATGLPATGTLEEMMSILHDSPDDSSSNSKDSIIDYCDHFFDCASFDDIPALDPCTHEKLQTDLGWSFLHIFTWCWAFAVSVLDKSSICLLALSIIFWDSVLVFGTPSPPRRKSYRWRNYPRHWMVLSSYMLFFGAKLMHPGQHIAVQLHGSFERAQSLHDMVDFSPAVFVQFHQQQAATVRSTFWDLEEPPKPVFAPVPDLPFLDCYSVAPPDLDPPFYDAVTTLEGEFVGNDTVSPASFDWLQLDGITDNIHHIDLSSAPIVEPTLDTISASAWKAVHQNDVLDPKACMSSAMGRVDLFPPSTFLSRSFAVIFDSGASLAISPSKDDFIGPIRPLPTERRLGGMANGLLIAGIGDIRWGFKSGDKVFIVHSKCYHVPDSKARLLSPQRLFNSKLGVSGRYIVGEHKSTLEYDGVGSLEVEYDSRSHLPIAVAKSIPTEGAHANLAILNDTNQNLTPAQKLLLLWHCRFGHKGFQAVQRILRQVPFLSASFKSASKCTIPRCEVCEYSKAHRRPTQGNTHHTNPKTDGHLKIDHLRAGDKVSVDHFESRLKGRLFSGRGGANSGQYVGGCIFVDHMSGYIHVEPQLGFSSSETIRAKQDFEQFALNHGVLVDSYLADNGVFKANAFVQHIHTHNQRLSYCGVNAHHKNAIAERSIRTVSECARAMLLHSSLHWKDGIDSSLWPFAIEYASYIYNHLPSGGGIAPADLFTGTTSPRHKLRDMHVWGAPVYVLDPTLQQGQKIPRWQPRSRRGIFMGFSRVHSSDVPMILNPSTGHVSPQYHVVFDDEFTTVPSLASDEEPPLFWTQLGLDDVLFESHVHRVPIDPHVSVELEDEWLTPLEKEEKLRRQARATSVRRSFNPSSTSTTPTTAAVESPTKLSVPPTPIPLVPSTPPTDVPPSPSASDPPLPPSPQPSFSPRRSTRNKRKPDWIVASHLTTLDPESHNSQSAALAYSAELDTDFDTGEDHCCDPRAYAAKHKLADPDQPPFHEALTGEYAEKWAYGMKKEIKQLIKQNTWKSVPRSSVPKGHPILKGTWAFKLKRLPDGSPSKFKARYCVRGDLQREGVDYFDTYAPVVQWSTVRLLLTLILKNGWVTKQVDYTNAFAQATLKETVFIEPPKGFTRKDKMDYVLKLITSLYGLKQAPRTFYEKLRAGLLERGFTQSNLDSCLFMKHNMICVVYVDDTIIAGPDSKEIEKFITSLGVTTDEQRHTFGLRDEGEVGDFLGIRITKTGPNSFNLTQPGLIQKVLKTSQMEESHPTRTPAMTTPLGKDTDGAAFSEPWNYPTVMGMLMFLANNSRPDIAYAVHQCARFTHQPKASHGAAVKRILRYLKGTDDKGITISPTNELTVDCYVDADFAGLWKIEDEQEPISVKSRSGHLIMFMGCPLSWQSKLQTQIALSTMEAEYIALSLAMRELIALREILKEIQLNVFHDPSTKPSYKTICRGFVPQSKVYEDNAACLKFASMPKMSPRTKHIAIPYHFFRTKVEELEIKVIAVDTKSQLADQFTKGLPTAKFEYDRKLLMGW